MTARRPKKPTLYEMVHRNAVMLEQLQSRFDAFGEGLQNMGEMLVRRFDERFAAAEERLKILKDVVRQNELARIASLERRVEVLEKRIA